SPLLGQRQGKQPNAERPVPRGLLREGVIIDAVPLAYERPWTYLDEAHIRTTPVKLVWPGSDAPVFAKDDRLSLTIAEGSRESPDFEALDMLGDNDLESLNLYGNTIDHMALQRLKRFKSLNNAGCMVKNDDDFVELCMAWPRLNGLTAVEYPRSSTFTDK